MIRDSVDSSGVASGESLTNINTGPIPDGAQCFVIENRRLYRFRKSSVAVADTIVVPIAGGGRWVLESAAPAGALALFAAATGSNEAPTAENDDWVPITTLAFALQGGAGCWTFAAGGCIATYNGPAGARYLVDLRTTVSLEDDATCNLVISLNDDMVLEAAGYAEGEQFTEFTVGTRKDLVLSCQRFVTLSPGDNIRPKFRSGATAENTTLDRLTFAAWPIP
jgi:hypothetical protein